MSLLSSLALAVALRRPLMKSFSSPPHQATISQSKTTDTTVPSNVRIEAKKKEVKQKFADIVEDLCSFIHAEKSASAPADVPPDTPDNNQNVQEEQPELPSVSNSRPTSPAAASEESEVAHDECCICYKCVLKFIDEEDNLLMEQVASEVHHEHPELVELTSLMSEDDNEDEEEEVDSSVNPLDCAANVLQLRLHHCCWYNKCGAMFDQKGDLDQHILDAHCTVFPSKAIEPRPLPAMPLAETQNQPDELMTIDQDSVAKFRETVQTFQRKSSGQKFPGWLFEVAIDPDFKPISFSEDGSVLQIYPQTLAPYLHQLFRSKEYQSFIHKLRYYQFRKRKSPSADFDIFYNAEFHRDKPGVAKNLKSRYSKSPAKKKKRHDDDDDE